MKHIHLVVSLALVLLLAVSVNIIEGSALNETSTAKSEAVETKIPVAPSKQQKKTARSGGDVTYTASYSVVRSALKRGKTMVMSVPVANKPAPVHKVDNAKES